MRTNDNVIFGIASQSLMQRFVAGRPSAVTFAVYLDAAGDDATVPEFSGTATIDAASTTLATATGYGNPDPRTLTVVSSTGFAVGKKYLLSGSQQSEWVEPIAIAGNVITARHPIAGSYLIGATLVSTYASAAVDAAWAANLAKLSDLGNPFADYRIKWTATINSATVIEYGFFDLIRNASTYSVDIEDLNLRVPGLRDALPTEYRADNATSLIRSAYQAMQADFIAMGLSVESLRDAQFIDEALIRRSISMLAAGGYHPLGVEWQAYYDATHESFGSFMRAHVQASAKHPRNDGSSAMPALRIPVWSK